VSVTHISLSGVACHVPVGILHDQGGPSATVACIQKAGHEGGRCWALDGVTYKCMLDSISQRGVGLHNALGCTRIALRIGGKTCM
jgi:uncharacterized metal-binding protein